MDNQLELILVQPEGTSDQQQVFTRYMILHKFDELSGRSAFVHFEDVVMSISVPVQFDDLLCNTNSKEVNLIALTSKLSEIHLMHKLESITITDDIIRSVYQRTDWNSPQIKGEHAEIKGIPGQASIELRDYTPSIRGKKQNSRPEGEDLVGKVVQLRLRITNDWISEIVTVPFTVTTYRRSGRTLRLEGENGVHISYEGVVRVRDEGDYLIVDIREENGKMNRSFYIWFTKPRY